MRKIGTLAKKAHAVVFGDYLFSKGIETDIEEPPSGGFSIWVHQEDRLEEAEEDLRRFQENPNAPDFAHGASSGRERFREAQKEETKTRSRVVDVRSQWGVSRGLGMPWLTAALMAASVLASILVFAYQKVPHGADILAQLFIADPRVKHVPFSWTPGLVEVIHGQVWRLITPVFLHFSIMHILFNMMALRVLGSAIEIEKGPKILALQVLVIGIMSNVAQYYVSGPHFGGMSGVLYGLFGYLWIRGKYDPNTQYVMDRQTITIMLVWLVLCLIGLLGPIANTAHFTGLIAGVVWASISVRRIPFTRIRF